ncbi:hypothetical protein R3P38DRAFT_3209762 [Favolaschia claudopus]|uniref:Uncharacterized protein n=1 Tax=Favolaschia claudopus TaxID=2862362 RepID=A0AAW0AIX1_9AGAR
MTTTKSRRPPPNCLPRRPPALPRLRLCLDIVSGSASASTSTSTYAMLSTIQKLAVDAVASPHKRWSGPNKMSTGSTPPRPIQHRAGTESPVRVVYKQSVADARKIADVNMMDFLRQGAASNVFQDHPTLHPAWDPENPPDVLHVYEVRVYPNWPSAFS